MHPRNIRIADYTYDLPDERIAKYPMAERDHSKLLVYRCGEVEEDHFYNLPDYISKDSLMVFNNTKVIQARIHFIKDTGARIEVFLLEPSNPTDYELMFQRRGSCSWHCLIGNLKKWKGGSLTRKITIEGKSVILTATRCASKEEITFLWNNPDITFAELLDAVGELPIPPYLNRETQESDLTTYQTIYSKIRGSVAAPTAGLHFTDRVLSAIDAKGIDREELTLHVGAGTFKPVKSEKVGGHEMHTETFCVRRQTIDKLIVHEGKATAVGTTSVRTLESLYYIGLKLIANPNLTPSQLHVGQWEPYDESPKLSITVTAALQALRNWMSTNHLDNLLSSTQIIIAPGYKYKIVDTLITNFHQPRSTLLLLVSAFVGDNWRTIYDYALDHDFRFLSYGDSSIIIP